MKLPCMVTDRYRIKLKVNIGKEWDQFTFFSSFFFYHLDILSCVFTFCFQGYVESKRWYCHLPDTIGNRIHRAQDSVTKDTNTSAIAILGSFICWLWLKVSILNRSNYSGNLKILHTGDHLTSWVLRIAVPMPKIS